jgi:ABC-2 type transport system ATP-binding protein
MDEFSASELFERCSQHLLLNVTDSKKAAKSLSKMGIDDYNVIDEKTLKITSSVEDSSKITKKLVEDGVGVYEISFKRMTLEEYYLERTGGNV